ncbi:DUF389 domain-containing protein [Lentilactobacillus parakefiri]|uniref:DUF389 domain-containing protein n=1 Tax=Lentilactobacillus parakefiri TaxID=152332 RepID=A0A224V4Y4_9LACO|nr:DUF389 domain-containing protein [Lentilactobacillus parakefiri]KRL74608.1 hypothetical protein FD08_GL001569 [Lentilactobacillus parakefiri DSM 10551]PAK99736.1 DUF389 domain-containing protein [Lentilactobacillus parakefiri]TDG92123.1 hypothetical protein C5L28_001514 [Lentilactobacillus parakefiri]GAW72047.1 hypothetical protein LPKJCM_01155 [Lentilactobacillus parakefiri]
MQQISTNTLNINVKKGLNFTWSTQAILFCAIIIACIGLNVDSAPVVIGAMLISPLMAPIVGIGYGLGNSDPKLLSKATQLFLIQVIIGVTGATIYFFISPLNTAGSQLLARTEPTLFDVLVAFFGGFAGVISSAKKDGGNVVPGVAIATALMPPLCTVGYGISHLDLSFILGAGYLFLINAFFIALATAVGTIFFRVRSGERLNVSLRQEVLIVIISIIVVIPSSISAYNIVHQSFVDTQLSQFINEKLSNQYIAKQTVNDKTISISVIGQRLNTKQINELQQSLKDYHLGNYQLSLTQLTKGNYITPREFQDYMKQSNTNGNMDNVNSNNNESLANVQNDIIKQYPKQINNVFVGQVQDKANHTTSLIAIEVSNQGGRKVDQIEKSAAKIANDNNINAVVRMIRPTENSN